MRQQEAKRTQGHPDHNKPVALEPEWTWFSMLGQAQRPGLGQPVQRHSQENDRHADLDRQADLQRLQQLQQLLPQSGHADETGQHHHGQTLHDHLIDPDQDFAACRRDAHPGQKLPTGRSGHLAGFDHLIGDFLQTQYGHADHRRDGKDDGHDGPRLGANADEHNHRDHIGKMRKGLRNVQDRVQDPLEPGRAPGQYPHEQAQHHRKGRGHNNDRQRLHRPFPLPHQGDPDEGAPRQRAQPPAFQGIAGHKGCDSNHSPGNGADVGPAAFAVKQVCGDIQQPFDHIGKGPRHGHQAKIVLQERKGGVDPVGKGHDQPVRRADQPLWQQDLGQCQTDSQRQKGQGNALVLWLGRHQPPTPKSTSSAS